MLTEQLLDPSNQRYMSDLQTRQLAKEYAERFDADNGDLFDEYAIRVSFDVYPAMHGTARNRVEFRELVRTFMRELQKSGVR